MLLFIKARSHDMGSVAYSLDRSSARRWRRGGGFLRGGADEFGDLGFGDLLQQAADQVVGAQALGLGLEIRADAVPQDGDGDFADVVHRHGEAAVHRGQGFAAVDQELAGGGRRPS